MLGAVEHPWVSRMPIDEPANEIHRVRRIALTGSGSGGRPTSEGADLEQAE